ncbi:MAG: hypothetical protein A2096_05180 [Spirochaetes bacterium GWF1_41_5]|nr:MAG: hypothetical protein A2096_05180 [Spirochaetes bacterium GWF1_41_5]HBE03033.1 hypothetical protein [Spirochaetia bacterium]
MIYAVNEYTGVLKWKIDLKTVQQKFAFGSKIPGKIKFPVIWGGYLFISDSSALYCLNKNSGSIIWARAGVQESDVKNFVIDGIYADPIIFNNKIFYGTRKNFIARDINNGHMLWSRPEITSYSGYAAYFDDKIFAQSRDQLKNTFELFCLQQKNGSIIWRKTMEIPERIFSPVVFKNSIFTMSSGAINCYTLENGEKKWSKDFKAHVTSAPACTDNELIVALDNRKICVISPENGEKKYEYDLGSNSAPVFTAVRDQIYITFMEYTGSGAARMRVKAFCFADQSELWTFSENSQGFSQPAASGGILFVPSDHNLYAIGDIGSIQALANNNIISLEDHKNSSNVRTTTGDDFIKPENIPTVKRQQPPPVLDEIKTGESVVIDNIYFEFDKAYLLPESTDTLDNLCAQLKKNLNLKIEIQGHTDNKGAAEYNLMLSRKRAETVMEYLIKNGISPQRLSAKGFGMANPVADNSSDEGRARNRRTEFLIIEK